MRHALAVAVLLTLLATGAAPAVADRPMVTVTLDPQPAQPPTAIEATRQKMNTAKTIKLDIKETPLGNVLDFIAEAARREGINIVIDRLGIEDAGISLDDPLDVHANNVSVAQALGLVLGRDLGYRIHEDGIVYVSSWERLNERLPTVTYEIGQVTEALRRSDDEGSIGERLRMLIERSVRGSEPWESLGGRATLDFAADNLMMVTTTEDAHEQVYAMLKNILLADRQRSERVRARLAETERQIAELSQQRARLQARVRELRVEGGRPDLTAEAVLSTLVQLRRDCDQRRLDVVRYEANLSAIRRQVAELEEAGRRAPETDIQLKDLQERVAALEAGGPGAENRKGELDALRNAYDARVRTLAVVRSEQAGRYDMQIADRENKLVQVRAELDEATRRFESYNAARLLQIVDDIRQAEEDVGRINTSIERLDRRLDVLHEQLDPVQTLAPPPAGDDSFTPTDAGGGLFNGGSLP